MPEPGLPYLSFSHWLRQRYGCAVRKISLNAGLGCPNKDGTVSREGCVFCDVNESGVDPERVHGHSIADQLSAEISRLRNGKTKAGKFIAYLQAGSNTHGPLEKLRDIYRQATAHPDVVSISISTRPDCVTPEVLDLIGAMCSHLEVWIELGVQSAHDSTLRRIGRHHDFARVTEAARQIKSRNFLICLHLILGLPEETRAMMVDTARAINALPIDAVKLHPLSITRGSRWAADWRPDKIPLMTETEYVAAAVDFLEALSPAIIIQRLTGGGRPEVHLAPDWCRHPHHTQRLIVEEFRRRGTRQGWRLK